MIECIPNLFICIFNLYFYQLMIKFLGCLNFINSIDTRFLLDFYISVKLQCVNIASLNFLLTLPQFIITIYGRRPCFFKQASSYYYAYINNEMALMFDQQFVLLLIEYMVVGFCHWMHPVVYLAALCWISCVRNIQSLESLMSQL